MDRSNSRYLAVVFVVIRKGALIVMKLDPKQKAWVAARNRHHLSHAHVQMARELGMNPSGLGKLDNHRQEPWKAPLPEFIERLYEKHRRTSLRG